MTPHLASHTVGELARLGRVYSGVFDIADYQRGDRIDLTAFGDLTYIGNGWFSGSAGQLRYWGGSLEIELDGNRVADFSVALSGSPAIASGDLLYA